jgi:hypothetical protein
MAVGVYEAGHQNGIAKIDRSAGGKGPQIGPATDGGDLIIRD